jgi:hypothetical protein
MPANDRVKILQQIVNDATSTSVERTEARLALAELNGDSSKPSRRYGRNSNVPQSQADIDCDIETHFRNLYDDRLDAQAQIEMDLSESTRAILDAFGSSLLWLFGNNAAETHILIDLHGKTQSDFVREKTLSTIRWIAGHSTIDDARQNATEFLNQLNSNTAKDKQ